MEQAENDNSRIRLVKIILSILYVLSIIVTALLLILTIGGLIIVGNTEGKTQEDKATIEMANVILIITLVLYVVSLIISIAGLYGAIKENRCIMITLTVLSALSVVVYANIGLEKYALVSLCYSLLTGVYAYMLGRRDKTQSPV